MWTFYPCEFGYRYFLYILFIYIYVGVEGATCFTILVGETPLFHHSLLRDTCMSASWVPQSRVPPMSLARYPCTHMHPRHPHPVVWVLPSPLAKHTCIHANMGFAIPIGETHMHVMFSHACRLSPSPYIYEQSFKRKHTTIFLVLCISEFGNFLLKISSGNCFALQVLLFLGMSLILIYMISLFLKCSHNL